jgi:hypothetical protein
MGRRTACPRTGINLISLDRIDEYHQNPPTVSWGIIFFPYLIPYLGDDNSPNNEPYYSQVEAQKPVVNAGKNPKLQDPFIQAFSPAFAVKLAHYF